MSGFDGVPVGKKIRDEVASHQPGDFSAKVAVGDGHFRITVKVVVTGGAVDVGVHAFRVLIVLRAVAVLEAEFVAVIAEVGALEL